MVEVHPPGLETPGGCRFIFQKTERRQRKDALCADLKRLDLPDASGERNIAVRCLRGLPCPTVPQMRRNVERETMLGSVCSVNSSDK